MQSKVVTITFHEKVQIVEGTTKLRLLWMRVAKNRT